MFHVVFPFAPGSIAVVHGLERCGEDCGESGPLSPTARRGTPEAIRDAFWMGKKKIAPVLDVLKIWINFRCQLGKLGKLANYEILSGKKTSVLN